MGLFSALFGGGGESSTSTSTTTNNADRRFVVDGNSVGISAEGSTVNVSSTDAGAVRAAMDLSESSTRTAAATIMGALGIAADSLEFQQAQVIREAEAKEAGAGSLGELLSSIKPEQWALAGLGLFGLVLVLNKGK